MVLSNRYIRSSDIVYARFNKSLYSVDESTADIVTAKNEYEIKCTEQEYQEAICWLEREMQTRSLKD